MTNPSASAFEPNYQIALIHPSTGDLLDILDSTRWQELSYFRVINDYGEFSLTISGNDRAATHASILDLIVEIYRENYPGAGYEVEGTYFSRYYNPFEDENGHEWIIISGVSLEHLIYRRTIYVFDDPVNAGGFITRQEPADSLMRNLVLYQMVTPAIDSARTFPGLTCAAVANIGYTWGVRASSENVLDLLKEGAIKGQVDFRITRTTGANFVFESLVIGTDRTYSTNYPSAYMLFDPRRGNMYSPNLNVDRKNEKTFCYVLGQGLEDERFIYPVSNSAQNDSPFNRIEVTTDARNNEDSDLDGLTAAGLETLNDQGSQIEFTFTPDLNAPDGKYNIDWFLGDRVTANYKDYMTDLRIFRVDVMVNAEGQTVTPQLTNEYGI